MERACRRSYRARVTRVAALALVVSACAGTAAPDAGRPPDAREDGGRDPSSDAGPPPFDFAFDQLGAPLTEGGNVHVEVGCQGGSHVTVGFWAGTDLGPEGTMGLAFALEGGPRERFTVLRAVRGEGQSFLESVRVVFSDAPEILAGPTPARLVGVTRSSEGVTHRMELPVTAVQGSVCETDGCTWTERTYRGPLTMVSGPYTTGCGLERVWIELALTGDDGAPSTARASPAVPADCAEPLGLVVGMEHDVVQRRATAPCLSPLYELVLDESRCRAICPDF